MKSIATGDKVALKRFLRTVMAVLDARSITFEARRLHILRLENQRLPASLPGNNQILGDFGLAVHGDRLAGQFGKVDALTLTPVRDLDTVVNHALRRATCPDPRFVEQIHRALFKDSCPDSAFNVGAIVALENNRVDAINVQELPKQQSGRAGSDDRHLCFHAKILVKVAADRACKRPEQSEFSALLIKHDHHNDEHRLSCGTVRVLDGYFAAGP